MKFVLLNPNWKFVNSVYFGCRSAHFPVEFGYAYGELQKSGHEVCLIDGHLENLSISEIQDTITGFKPDFTILSTAPTYLFWRCPQPELTEPMKLASAIRHISGKLIAVGPHGSSCPKTVLEKLNCDGVIRGEFEQRLSDLAGKPWIDLSFLHSKERNKTSPAESNLLSLSPISWPQAWINLHSHHHHRFDESPVGPGAEIEASRGCPYSCSFCAKTYFRNSYRRRPVEHVLDEVDGLMNKGVKYIYFIDEIFLPRKKLLYGLEKRHVKFGIQTRIDSWSLEMLEALGKAGCVSIEAGVETLNDMGRDLINKKTTISSTELTKRLIHAKKNVPFVQANLIKTPYDNAETIQEWRKELLSWGVWANDPVPIFPYPGSPLYETMWGQPDERSWERAHHHYLTENNYFSDLQDNCPRSLTELENDVFKDVFSAEGGRCGC